MKFEAFTDLRTGHHIDSLEAEIDEVFSLSHEPVVRTERISTKYDVWIHGDCPKCNCPVDSWHHPRYCGSCGQPLDWGSL